MTSNAIIKGMEKVDEIEVKAFDLNNINKDYLNESKGIISGILTYCVSLDWQIKQYVDIDREHALAGKLGGTFATANYIHGGGNIAINAILSSLLIHRMTIYYGGGALDTPIIH